MPDIKRVATLIERLSVLSDDNKVPWVETSDERAFQAALKGYTVTIAQEFAGQNWGEDVYHYVIKIHDPFGKLLDAARASDFPQDYYVFNGEVQARFALRTLHDVARRKALKVEEALDDLLGSL